MLTASMRRKVPIRARLSAALSEHVGAVEPDRDRAVILEPYQHLRAESSLLNRNPPAADRVGKVVDERLGDFGWRCVEEAGTATFACVGVEGELGDHQHGVRGALACQIANRAVHTAISVLEDAQIDRLFRQAAAEPFGVVVGHADQRQQAWADLANDLVVNGH